MSLEYLAKSYRDGKREGVVMPKVRRVEFKFEERSLEDLRIADPKDRVEITNPVTGETRVMILNQKLERPHTCCGVCMKE